MRTTILLSIGLLALAGAIFAGIAVVSYRAIHGSDATGTAGSELPPLAIVGAQETVFDWSEQGCSQLDFPDSAAKAFRDESGQVHLIASHYVTRAETGPTLDSVRHDCSRLMRSNLDGNPAHFSDREWLVSPYTLDGRVVNALVHNEYQGHKHVGRCDSGEYERCWYNSITLARSTDGGRTFSQARAPRHLVASAPYPYEPDRGPYGVFAPSNIVYRPQDQHYYALVAVQRFGAQREGSCVIRTRRLDRADSWRAWDGNSFSVRFVNPYGDAESGAINHVCAPVSFDEIGTMSHSLTHNTYLDKYVLVSAAGLRQPGRRGTVWGFYYSTSDDLIEWAPRKLIREAVMHFTYKCGGPNPVAYPSLLDPKSRSRNFETTGREPWLYFTRFHYKRCAHNWNRDLVRVPVRFSK